MNAAWVVVNMWGGVATQPLQDGKKKKNFVHLEVVGMKNTFQLSLAA